MKVELDTIEVGDEVETVNGVGIVMETRGNDYLIRTGPSGFGCNSDIYGRSEFAFLRKGKKFENGEAP